MRAIALTFTFAFLVAACATAANNGDDDTSSDGGSPNDGSQGVDTGPGCDKCGGASCLDLKTDSNNCGSCGNVCADKCCNGQCIDTTSDNANCGACGSACMNGNSCCSAS